MTFENSQFAEPDDIEIALKRVGELLASDGHRYAIVILGGAALNLHGIVARTTRDVDIVAFASAADPSALHRPPEPLPAPLLRVIARVAGDLDLPSDWLNPGPASYWELGLPPGFAERVEWRRYDGLNVGIASRFDLIHFKLEAAADQPSAANNRHLQDLVALQPSRAELDAAADWVRQRNAGSQYNSILDTVVEYVVRNF